VPWGNIIQVSIKSYFLVFDFFFVFRKTPDRFIEVLSDSENIILDKEERKYHVKIFCNKLNIGFDDVLSAQTINLMANRFDLTEKNTTTDLWTRIDSVKINFFFLSAINLNKTNCWELMFGFFTFKEAGARVRTTVNTFAQNEVIYMMKIIFNKYEHYSQWLFSYTIV
jgi:hypothetical protein